MDRFDHSAKQPMPHALINTLVRFAFRTLVGLVLTLLVALGGYLLFTYHFTYSKGESVGYVQKLSYNCLLYTSDAADD